MDYVSYKYRPLSTAYIHTESVTIKFKFAQAKCELITFTSSCFTLLFITYLVSLFAQNSGDIK